MAPASNAALSLVEGLLQDPQALGAKILAVRARRSGLKNFATFVKQAWLYVPQVEPLVWGWHMDAIAQHAEALARAEINWLAVSIPPGHAKSVFTSVLLPAWIWTWWPKCQFIFGSYAHNFVVRDARRCREVIASDWYQETYCKPAGWGLREDYGSADNFSNTAGGVRFATSVSGSGAGLRAHLIGIDDPLNIGDSYSKKARDEAVSWMSQTLSQRWVAGYPPRFMLTMQRLHEEDPTAWLLRQKGAQCLRLPSEFEKENRCITYHIVEKRNGHVEKIKEEFWRDPRVESGDLLFPELYPRERIDSDKEKLGTFGFAAQHQQRPSPEGGGLFKVEDWRFWKSNTETMESLGHIGGVRPRNCASLEDAPPRPINFDDLEETIISVDPTFRKTNDGSFNAIHVWAKIGSRRLLLDRVHRRMDFTETITALLGIIKRWPDARRKLIEGKANGDAIISTLEKSHGVIGLEAVPVSGDKMQRAQAMQPYHTGHNIELPEGAPWLEEYIQEHAAFPNAAHDDDVDAQSQGLQGLERERTTMEMWMELGVDEYD